MSEYSCLLTAAVHYCSYRSVERSQVIAVVCSAAVHIATVLIAVVALIHAIVFLQLLL
jgi:hypothetical protein